MAQDRPRVEVYRRSTLWDLEVYGAEDRFRLESVGAEIPVASVYAGVDYEQPQ